MYGIYFIPAAAAYFPVDALGKLPDIADRL